MTKRMVEVKCFCGKLYVTRKDSIISGHTKSCGCLKKIAVRKVLDKYVITHGMSKTPEWYSYSGAKQRCTNPNSIGYKNYGGRGIKFNFYSFEEFYKELGPRPKGYTLDRIDNDGNYEVGNVRWASHSEQMLNRHFKGKPWSAARRAACR